MALQTATKVIGDNEYKVTQFAGMRNFKVLIKLSQLLGPALAAGSKGLDLSAQSLLDQDINIEGIVNALLSVADPDKLEAFLLQDLLASTFVDNEQLSASKFNSIFAGPKLLEDLPKLLWFIIQHNYGNFSGLVASITKAKSSAPAAAGPQAN